MKTFILQLILIISFVAFLGTATNAQQPTATLTGVVTDPTGAVITNATVTATNKATNLSRTTTTDGDGVYTISSLPVGEYFVKISSTGFAQMTNSAILNVGQTTNFNQTLFPAGANYDSVFITATAPLVDANTSKVDAVIKDKEIENLPLNGRNYLELALLTPGNSPAPNFDPTKTNTVVISSAG